MWIQLTTIQQITVAGESHTYNPGDWVNVGRQTAMKWLATKQAQLPNVPMEDWVFSGANVGVALIAGTVEIAKDILGMYSKLSIKRVPAPSLPFERTVILDPVAAIQPAFIAFGLGLLATWEICVPLWDYKVLACQVGSDEERERTKAVIRDLRVPLYDTRLIFCKRTPEMERIIQAWNDEPGTDRRLAFLRTIYKAKPLLLALPCHWTGHNAPA